MTLWKAAVFSWGTEGSVTSGAAKPAKPSPLPAGPVLGTSCSCPRAYVVFSRVGPERALWTSGSTSVLDSQTWGRGQRPSVQRRGRVRVPLLRADVCGVRAGGPWIPAFCTGPFRPPRTDCHPGKFHLSPEGQAAPTLGPSAQLSKAEKNPRTPLEGSGAAVRPLRNTPLGALVAPR